LQEEHRQHSLLGRADTKEVLDIRAARSSETGISVPVRIGLGLAFVVACAALFVHDRGGSVPVQPVKNEMVQVAAGEFIYQKKEKKKLPDYWIGKTEVTLGQYAEFLQALENDPGSTSSCNHPDQPAKKTGHKPESWDDLYKAASAGGLYNNNRVNLNCPVVDVDWWDAWAYAHWKGQRLPTELEWEKAARGSDGRNYPWGDEVRPDAANLGDDYNPKGGSGGTIDGQNFLQPVDKIKKDISPCRAAGMAGNVEEWTDTWMDHPDYPDLRVPVVRGGSFIIKSAANVLTARNLVKSPDVHRMSLGFRTASDKVPAAAPGK